MFIVLAVLGLVAALVVVPIDTKPLASRAHPFAEYEDAMAFASTRQREERDSTMADGATILLVHGHRTARSVVLVHGLTNSPRQFRELAELLYARGDNVFVPRLPEHGLREGDVAALGKLSAERYRTFGDEAVDVAAGLGDSVMVIGLSAGGSVAIWIAQHRADVRRVVVISPALSLARVPAVLDAPAMNAMVRLPTYTLHQHADTLRPHAYFGVSTHGLGETLRFGATLIGTGERETPSVRDIVLVLNDNDHTVDAAPALRLATQWRSHADVQTTVYRFARELRLPHDVIDVTQRCGMPEVVYPTVVALLEHRTPVDTVVEGRCADRPAAR